MSLFVQGWTAAVPFTLLSPSRLFVQNAAAAAAAGVLPAHPDVNPSPLCSLHSTDFQFTFNAKNDWAPSYLSEIWTLGNLGRTPRSSGQPFLHVPRSRLKQSTDRDLLRLLPPGGATVWPPVCWVFVFISLVDFLLV